MSDDLVKRLRDLAQAKHDDLSIGDEAADRIAELEKALRPLSEMFLYPDDLGFETAEDIKSDPDWCSDANDLKHENLFVLRRDIRKARAALEGKKS